MADRHIGYIVHFEGERDGGAFVYICTGWVHIAQSMQIARPGATICVEPVNEIPGWCGL